LLSGLSARRSGDHFRRPAAEFSSRMFLAQAMFARTLAVTKPLPEQSEHRTSTRPPWSLYRALLSLRSANVASLGAIEASHAVAEPEQRGLGFISQRDFLGRRSSREFGFRGLCERERQHGRAAFTRDFKDPFAPVYPLEIAISQEISRCLSGFFLQASPHWDFDALKVLHKSVTLSDGKK
jgi:hypothetical protein